MRHRRAGVHLSRTTAHRKALFSNLVAALLTNERIRTTDAKAKATRRLAERTITWARRLGDILGKKPDRRSPDESARVVHAVRMARRVVRDRFAVSKLFDEIGPRFMARRGGYTRIVKIGQRPGDAAPMSLLELIPDGAPTAEPHGKADKGASPASKGEKEAGKQDKKQDRKQDRAKDDRKDEGRSKGGKAAASASRAQEAAASRRKGAPPTKGQAGGGGAARTTSAKKPKAK
jgi:large subunit ribosomal protein L17